MADDDQQKLEELKRQQAELEKRLEAQKKANDIKYDQERSQIKSAQREIVGDNLAMLERNTGVRIDVPLKELEQNDTRDYIARNGPSGAPLKTHTEVTDKKQKAEAFKLIPNLKLDPYTTDPDTGKRGTMPFDPNTQRPLKVFVRSKESPLRTIGDGKVAEGFEGLTEIIVSTDPEGIKGTVRPKAVIREIVTFDEKKAFVSVSTTKTVNDDMGVGQTIEVRTEDAKGNVTEQKITIGKDSLKMETTANGKTTVETFDKEDLLKKAKVGAIPSKANGEAFAALIGSMNLENGISGGTNISKTSLGERSPGTNGGIAGNPSLTV